MIKRSIQEEDITILSIYLPNIGAHQYIRQTLTSIKEMDSNTIINLRKLKLYQASSLTTTL